MGGGVTEWYQSEVKVLDLEVNVIFMHTCHVYMCLLCMHCMAMVMISMYDLVCL